MTSKMLPILVLALATSAFAAPGYVNIAQYSNEVAPLDGSPLSGLFNLIDDGDKSINAVNLGAVLKDLAGSGNPAAVNGQAIAAFGELASGVPGDACAAANYINAYTKYARSGNPAGVRQALGGFVQALNTKIDYIANLVQNPNSVKNTGGVRGGCANGGRSYNIDDAWDSILGSSAYPLSLVQEQYGVAKRLFCSISARGSNLGAAVTAAALPPSAQLFDQAANAIANFISAAASKGNVVGAAQTLKSALSNGYSRINL